MLKQMNVAVMVILAAAMASGVAIAQDASVAEQEAKPAAKTDAPKPTPTPPGQPVNLQIELTITDQTGPGDPTRKVVSLMVADRQRGFIRSRGTVRVPDGPGYNVTINVDARPTILSDGTLRVELSFEYQPRPGEHEAANVTSASPTAAPRFPGAEVLANPPSTLNQQVSVIVRSGQPLTISQAVDPASGRQTSVELKATILK